MPFFDIFASPGWSPLRMRTKWCQFSFFPRAFNQRKIKALRPKITKIASRGSCLKWSNLVRKARGCRVGFSAYFGQTPFSSKKKKEKKNTTCRDRYAQSLVRQSCTAGVSRQECERQQCERHQCEANSANANFECERVNSACTTRVRKTEVRTTPVRSQQCECQQCEGVNSANETRVRMSNVRMPAVRCDIGAKKVRQQCECQQCELHFFLFTDSDWIWTERKKGASENLNARDMLSHSNWPFFSSPSPSTPWLQCLCLCKLICQLKRGKGNGKALVHGAVLQHYWVGEEDRRKLVSAIPDFRAVVGMPRSTYSGNHYQK